MFADRPTPSLPTLREAATVFFAREASILMRSAAWSDFVARCGREKKEALLASLVEAHGKMAKDSPRADSVGGQKRSRM